MKNRGIIAWLLLGIAALTAAHLSLDYYGGEKARAQRRTTLLERSDEYTRIELARKSEPAMVFARQEEWRLVEPYAGSVDETRVYRLLDGLTAAAIGDEMSDSELLKIGQTRAGLKLDDPEYAISVKNSKGSVTRITFGGLTPLKDCVYAAIDGVDAVFTVSTNVLTLLSTDAGGFRRRSLFTIASEMVDSLEIRRASMQPMVLARDGDHWKADGKLASSSKVKQFVDEVTTASAVDFVWPVGSTNEAEVASASELAARGLDGESAVTLTLRCVDGRNRKLSLGGETTNALVYALAQNGSAIVTVPLALKAHAMQDALSFTDARLFPFEATSVKAFKLVVGGVEYAVARGEADAWRLDAPIVAPADGEVARMLLDKVLALSSADLSAEGVQVSVTTNLAPVTVSSEKLLSGVRLEDLRLKEVLKLDAVVVKRIVSQVGDGKSVKPESVVFASERNAWNVESSSRKGAVKLAGVERVLSAINPLKAVSIAKLKVTAADMAAFGLDHPAMTVAIDLTSENAVRRNILIGNPTADGRFATVGSSDAVFVLSNQTVGALTSALVEE